MKRSRGRGRRPQSNNTNPNRTFDSAGPEIKIRGSAAQVYEKYLQLARDANVSGDRVMAENYLQHAEHYYRLLAANQPQQQQSYQGNHQPNGNGRPQGNGADGNTLQNGSGPSFTLADGSDDEGDEDDNDGAAAAD